MSICILYSICYFVTTFIETSKPNYFSRIKKGRKTLNNTKGDVCDTECIT